MKFFWEDIQLLIEEESNSGWLENEDNKVYRWFEEEDGKVYKCNVLDKKI